MVSASATIESDNIVTKGADANLVYNGSGFVCQINVSYVVMESGRVLSLSLYNISRTMAGQYTFSARNSCGNDSEKVVLVFKCEESFGI